MSAQLKGRQKAAALLIALGPDVSGQVLRHFTETDVEKLTFEVFQLEKISEEAKDQVLEESYHMAVAREYITTGGMDFAREILVRGLGADRAQDVINRLGTAQRSDRFKAARDADPVQLAEALASETPQAIALVLSNLPSSHAAQVIAHLSPELRTQVALRIGTMDRTPPEVLDQVEAVVARRLGGLVPRHLTQVGGTAFTAQVLANVGRGTEKQILAYLDQANGEVAAEVRKLMFVFEDLLQLENRSLQRVLRDVDTKDLGLAMRGTSAELQEHVFSNLSTRAAQGLRDDMTVGGPVRARQVEEAQQRIVAIVRRLEESEDIVVQRSNEDILL